MKTMIQAQPCWSLLYPIHRANNDGTREIVRVGMSPIIAWHIDTATPDAGDPLEVIHFTTPVTVEPQNFDASPMVMDPSGEVFEIGRESHGQFIPFHSAAESEHLIARFKDIEAERNRGRGVDAGPNHITPTAAMTAEQATELVKSALARIERPQPNAQGGTMQVSAAYWRLSKVMTDFLMPRLEQEHGKEHAHSILTGHGQIHKPG
jgi:hypothetical protein